MKYSTQPIPSRDVRPAPHIPNPVPARRASLFAAAFISGCGAAAVQESVTSTSSSADLVLVTPNTLPAREFRSFLQTLRSRSGQFRVELAGEEGVIGDWAFRRTDHSERGGFSFYDLFLATQLMGSGEPDRVEMLYQGRIDSPYRNIPVECTPNVGSDVFVVALPGRIVFDFRSPITGKLEKRVFEFDEGEVGPDPTVAADYDSDLNRILIHFISESRITTIVFNLRSAEISLRHITPE